MKPRLKRITNETDGKTWWACKCNNCLGVGDTSEEAYADWVKAGVYPLRHLVSLPYRKESTWGKFKYWLKTSFRRRK